MGGWEGQVRQEMGVVKALCVQRGGGVKDIRTCIEALPHREVTLALPPSPCMHEVCCTRPGHWRTNCSYKRQPTTNTGIGCTGLP